MTAFDANDCRRAGLPLSFESATPISHEDSRDEWPEPIPFGTPMAPPAFPIDALPLWLREWVTSEAITTQTPPDLAAMLALAAFSTACARMVRVQVRDDWYEPTNLFACIVLPPANRKSAVFRDALKPLVQFERDQHERMESEIRRSADTVAIAQKRLVRAIERASKPSDSAVRLDADEDVHKARAELARAEANLVVAPRLICGDVTQEALAALLAQQGERMAVMDAEGCGPIAVMLGRYSDGATSVDLYLRGHAGDPHTVDRKSGTPVRLDSPAITLALCAQPEVLRQLGARRELRGLGLLARILWCVPLSTVGSRSSEPPPMPAGVRAAYEGQIRVILQSAIAEAAAEDGEPYTLHFSDQAWAVLREFTEWLEPQLGAGGKLEHLADWAGKLAGAVARIAGLLHVAEHGADAWQVSDVGELTAECAVKIGRYLLGHAHLALEAVTHPALASAQHVLAWLIKHRVTEISRRDLQRALRGRFPDVAAIEAPLRLLADHDCVRLEDLRVEGSAVPRTVVHVRVNPPVHTPAEP